MDLSISKCGGPDICQDPTTFTPMATFSYVDEEGDQDQRTCMLAALQANHDCDRIINGDWGDDDNTIIPTPAEIAAACCSDG